LAFTFTDSFWFNAVETEVYAMATLIIEEFSKAGLDTAKSILEQDVQDLVKRTDLEEETILDVIRILREEFEE
uniref:protein O-mannosyl-transferase family n=1 Tax=Gelidibacter sp. TaxID=2018083 RepID=UPI00404B9202